MSYFTLTSRLDGWNLFGQLVCVILHAVSWIEFAAELVSALTWPITALIALVFLRPPLERWLRERPSRIKADPVELQWDSLISKAQADLDQPAVPDPAALTSSVEAGDRDLYLLARANPPLAILGASRRVEAELRRQLSAIGVEVPQQGLSALALLADRHGLISEATQKSIAGLVMLRNLAVHDPNRVSVEEALEFVALAQATQCAISATGKDRRPGSAGE